MTEDERKILNLRLDKEELRKSRFWWRVFTAILGVALVIMMGFSLDALPVCT